MSGNEITAFVCGNPKDHKCDDNGPTIYGGESVPTTTDEIMGGGKGYTWGSATCSVCGMTAMDRSLWQDF